MNSLALAKIVAAKPDAIAVAVAPAPAKTAIANVAVLKAARANVRADVTAVPASKGSATTKDNAKVDIANKGNVVAMVKLLMS